ncbi:MAG: porin family protein [Zoogloeaceae bacterium]|nr:porin family protein [Zoogloeaceae bacterium]
MKPLKQSLLLLASLASFNAAAASPFEGAYLGAYAGYGKAEDKGIGHWSSSGAVDGWTHQPEPRGFLLGAVGGYHWLVSDRVVLGLEADLEARSNNSDRDIQKDKGVPDPDYKATTRIKGSSSLRGRLGYRLGEQALVFFTGGYTAASVKRTWHDEPSDRESHSDIQGGWTAGFGLDYALSDKLAARIEYRHADYGTHKVTARVWGEYYQQKLTEDSLRFGLNYRF